MSNDAFKILKRDKLKPIPEQSRSLLGKVITLNVIPELCCTFCSQVIHNHVDPCPVCSTIYADTDAYGVSIVNQNVGFVLECWVCGTKFQLILINPNKWKVISIPNIK